MHLSLLCYLSFIAACGAPIESGEAPASTVRDKEVVWASELLPGVSTQLQERVCEQASAQFADCFGFSLEYWDPQQCDPDVANWFATQTCESAETHFGMGAGLFRWIESTACRLGWSYYCDPNECYEPAEVASCQDLIEYTDCRACQYYSCVDADSGLDCGDGGYFRGYGQKYCSRFSAITALRMSAEGELWMENVRRCLMRSMEGILPDADCANVKAEAFASHPPCYVESGLCSLPPADWLQIVATIAPWDNDLRQVIISGSSCLREWFGQ